jgi:DNA-binding transcriptional LysR family regulator
MLDVHRLRLLRELHRRGTLAAVARALSYSPSAGSQQLSQLEAEAGVRLLEPVGRGVRLTPQALLLVDHADAVLQRLELAEADLAASLTEVAGTVRVASFASVLLRLVPTALSRLAEEHPRLLVRFVHKDPGPAFEALLSHDVDLVLGEDYPGVPEPRLPGVYEEDLGQDLLHLALPATGPLSVHTTVADLADAPWVMDPDNTASGGWERAVCRAAGFEPDVRFITTEPLLQAHLVQTGHAAGLLADLLKADIHHTLRLLPLPDSPTRRLYTGIRASSRKHPAVRAIHNSLLEALETTRTAPSTLD